jgi:inositol-1,4,5-trisphosphate 5-phosphatase
LGSVFEDKSIEQTWLTQFNQIIEKVDPDIIALHCQEIGGKDFSLTMPMVSHFVRRFESIPALSNYDKVRIFMDTDFSDIDQFTALGSLYFIHSRISSVKMWNFRCQQFQDVKGREVSSSCC